MLFPYMIGKEDVGSYKNTYEHTLKIFASQDPQSMAQNSGTKFDPEKSVFTLLSLGQELNIKFPEGTIWFGGTNHTPLWEWRLIVLNHLARADDAPPAGSLIAYRETENGSVFNSAFYNMAIAPLIESISDKPAGKIKKACLELGAQLREGADVCTVFDFLPRFPVTVKIWLQDDELAGSANFLFDAGANHYLHTEDIAVVGSLIATFLIKQYELMNT